MSAYGHHKHFFHNVEHCQDRLHRSAEMDFFFISCQVLTGLVNKFAILNALFTHVPRVSVSDQPWMPQLCGLVDFSGYLAVEPSANGELLYIVFEQIMVDNNTDL